MRMISFSHESALICTRPETSGPSSIPTSRKTTISGTLIHTANRRENVPKAMRMRKISRMFLAISMLLADSTFFSLDEAYADERLPGHVQSLFFSALQENLPVKYSGFFAAE